MDPFQLIRSLWSDTRTRIIFPGLLLMLGAFLALKPITTGRMVCDGGTCLLQHVAAFGTVQEAFQYPASDIREFRTERGNASLMRIIIDRGGIDAPLTPSFSPNVREIERIMSEGARFIADGASARFVATMEVAGPHAFLKPVSLLMLIVGAALGGHTLSRIPRDEFRL